MKDNVLFVNRDKAVIKEFQDAMCDYTFEIDTAVSGLEAAMLLKKKTYKVVITGMNLSTYNGIKLITYLNEYCPNTACIVYTEKLDTAQLRLLVNKRSVFRIFLVPANYRGDFYHAIQDGFSYYDMKEAEEEEIKLLETIKVQKKVRKPENIQWGQLKRFLYPILEWTVQEFDSQLSEAEQQALVAYEQSILEYYLKADYIACQSLEELLEQLQKEFDAGNGMIHLQVNRKPANTEAGLYEQLHFIIWLLAGRIRAVSLESELEINIDFRIPFRTKFQICGKVREEIRKKSEEQQIYRQCTKAALSIVESIADKCNCEVTADTINYEIELKTEYKKRIG